MTVDLAREAIDTLLDLAQRGEIDPWDVQVIDAIDHYLNKIGMAGDSFMLDDWSDLPQSGQTFLWASMLVLLKADRLEALSHPEEPEEPELFESLAASVERLLPTQLERHIRRRPSAPPLRRRRVTLPELIAQIQRMAQVLETRAATPRTRARPHSRREAQRTVTELAHNENLTELAAQLAEFLAQYWPQLGAEVPSIDLDGLIEAWAARPQPAVPDPHASPTRDRVGLFWALLLLSSQSQVILEQDEFYQDLRIQPLLTEAVNSAG
ncbi:MAG: segregation/condensation protein A [Spirulinaceae cyanobacterium RM2_2_10]|nr:segregation/condensation protein A [Spirulinaceae cyanobacterium SM2_1_0]NJO20825.1 segregation/condensation protein A [Spirulinaceae cyanobacterium RM2_2_10]